MTAALRRSEPNRTEPNGSKPNRDEPNGSEPIGIDTVRAGVAAAPVVQLTGVGKLFRQGRSAVRALDRVDLRVMPGEFVSLLGASGCGKSTLLNLVAGLDQPSAGRVLVNASRPAVMFQEAALMPWLTAAGNVELALRLAGVGRAARQAKAGELLELVRLAGQGHRRPHELSGGMLQRVALARALASTLGAGDGRPGLLLMDEPFAALDAITRDLLQGELLRIWRQTRTAVVFVTHDVREAVRLGERLVLLSSRPGRVAAEWPVGGLTGTAEHAVVEQVSARLREELARHAA